MTVITAYVLERCPGETVLGDVGGCPGKCPGTKVHKLTI